MASPRGQRLHRGVDARLAFAVVTERGGLEHRRRADLGNGGVQFRLSRHGGKRRYRQTGAGEETLLAQALLRRVQDMTARTHGHTLFGGNLGNLRSDILELEGDDIDAAHEVAHGVELGVASAHLARGELAGG
jgi:hypothetical protein